MTEISVLTYNTWTNYVVSNYTNYCFFLFGSFKKSWFQNNLLSPSSFIIHSQSSQYKTTQKRQERWREKFAHDVTLFEYIRRDESSRQSVSSEQPKEQQLGCSEKYDEHSKKIVFGAFFKKNFWNVFFRNFCWNFFFFQKCMSEGWNMIVRTSGWHTKRVDACLHKKWNVMVTEG